MYAYAKKHLTSISLLSFAALMTVTAVPASGQLANASASSLGVSGNNTATVRGFAAISVNPAGLGMPGSGVSFALAPIQLRTGLDPITLSDVVDFEGILIPASTKEAWLNEVSANGGQTGSVGIDLSAVAVTFGNIGFQISTVAASTINLPPDMVEVLLFGNGGRTGTAIDLDLGGATVDAFAATTAGISFAIPVGAGTKSMALGATLKYTMGHVLAIGRASGALTSDPIGLNANFPMVHSCEIISDGNGTDCDDLDLNGGTGLGLDLGFMMQNDRFSFGLSVTNVVNTFEWDEDVLAFRAGSVSFASGESESNFDPEAYSGAPAALRNAVNDMVFKPSVQVGVAYDVSGDFTVSGDLHRRFSDVGIATTPKFHLGVGAEFRGLKILHLRGGGAIISGGQQYSGGASIVMGPLNLSAAVAVQTGDLGENVIGQFALSFGNR